MAEDAGGASWAAGGAGAAAGAASSTAAGAGGSTAVASTSAVDGPSNAAAICAAASASAAAVMGDCGGEEMSPVGESSLSPGSMPNACQLMPLSGCCGSSGIGLGGGGVAAAAAGGDGEASGTAPTTRGSNGEYMALHGGAGNLRGAFILPAPTSIAAET